MQYLAEALHSLLYKQQLMLTTAESCTGGWVAKMMTDIAGSSASFDRGFITYSNAAKIEMLSVSPQTLARYGAVSEAIVMEMTAGALQHSQADIALAISGIAGPSGGTAEKPVGTVCFAWQKRGEAAQCSTQCFSGNRDAIRASAVCYILKTVANTLT